MSKFLFPSQFCEIYWTKFFPHKHLFLNILNNNSHLALSLFSLSSLWLWVITCDNFPLQCHEFSSVLDEINLALLWVTTRTWPDVLVTTKKLDTWNICHCLAEATQQVFQTLIIAIEVHTWKPGAHFQMLLY